MNLFNNKPKNFDEALSLTGDEAIGSANSRCSWRIEAHEVSNGSRKVCSNAHSGHCDLETVIRRCQNAMDQRSGYSSEEGPGKVVDDSVAICITAKKDCVEKYRIYVAVGGCGEAMANLHHAQLAVPYLDEYIHSLGTGWNIGGAIPKDYQRIEEDTWP